MPILSVSQVHHIVMDITTIVGLHTSDIKDERVVLAMIWLKLAFVVRCVASGGASQLLQD